jgi:hypothetical protein
MPLVTAVPVVIALALEWRAARWVERRGWREGDDKVVQFHSFQVPRWEHLHYCYGTVHEGDLDVVDVTTLLALALALARACDDLGDDAGCPPSLVHTRPVTM